MGQQWSRSVQNTYIKFTILTLAVMDSEPHKEHNLFPLQLQWQVSYHLWSIKANYINYQVNSVFRDLSPFTLVTYSVCFIELLLIVRWSRPNILEDGKLKYIVGTITKTHLRFRYFHVIKIVTFYDKITGVGKEFINYSVWSRITFCMNQHNESKINFFKKNQPFLDVLLDDFFSKRADSAYAKSEA